MPSLAAAEPDVTEFQATVERVDDTNVVLDQTYFYPEGGGQPADRGVLEGTRVNHVHAEDGVVVHELAQSPSFETGETVGGVVDEVYRTYLRRAHTASHLLYGAGRRVLENLGYGGFDISEEKVRVDFETSTTIDDATLVELERLVNRAVWESREVTWEQLPREDALADEDIAFNTKTEEGVTGQEQVRVVSVDGWDRAACGGTHVRQTDEIGPVMVLDRSNPGEGLTRVEFAVGPVAIDRRATDALAARTAARGLDTQTEALPEAIERLQERNETLTEQVDDLREQVIEARLADLEETTVTRDGRTWLAGSVPTDNPDALVAFAQRLESQAADVIALVGESGSYLAVATDGTVDAAGIVASVTDAFGGGGGGSDTVAQAGGLDAPVEDVVAFLRS